MRKAESGIRVQDTGYRMQDTRDGDEGLWDRCPSVPVVTLNEGGEVKTICGSGSGQRVPESRET